MSLLLDANILLYAKFSDFQQHEPARCWLDERLSAPDPLGIPWVSLSAFVRIATNRRLFAQPLGTSEAGAQMMEWSQRRNVWHPEPGQRFGSIFQGLLDEAQATGNLVPDAYLGALSIEHGLSVVSSDADFARFADVHWLNPLRA